MPYANPCLNVLNNNKNCNDQETFMLKKCIFLLFLTAQCAVQAADQTHNAKTSQLIYIDIRRPYTYLAQSTISIPITDDFTFAELQSELNKTMSCPMQIGKGLRFHNVADDHPDHSLLIDAHSKVKDSRWCSPYYIAAQCKLIAFLPRPPATNVKHKKGVV